MSVSIARNSLARLTSDATSLVFASLAGIVTARLLDPAGKGAFAALVSLQGILASVATMGLGDAAAIVVGKREVTLSRFVRVTLVPILVTSAVAALALVGISRIVLAGQGSPLGDSVTVAAAGVPLACLRQFGGSLLNARELIIQLSIIRSFGQAATLGGVLLFVLVIPLHITGGMLAQGLASALVVVPIVFLLLRLRIRFAPSWDPQLLIRAVKLGAVIELSQLVISLASRVDVLFVYLLDGRANAGRFSVALTMGQLVAFASLALSFAVFPRVARLESSEGFDLVARASRLGLATSLVGGLILIPIIPTLTPLLFGENYSGAIVPALILVLGGALWAEQNILARGRTATGRTRLQLAAYSTTLIAMVALDLVLIPLWGIIGAAIASTAATGAGLTVCVVSYRRDAAIRGVPLEHFLPGRDDFRLLFDFGMTLVGAGRGRDRS